MVLGLPSQYIFMLKCGYMPGCCHPICKAGKPTQPHQWHTGGPSVNLLPLPIVDPDRQWGGSCSACTGACSGHYKTVLTDVGDTKAMKATATPLSSILKEEFSKSQGSGVSVPEAAEKSLLSTEDTQIWLDHLNTIVNNRKRGAAKAAVTRNKIKKTVVEPIYYR